MFKPFLMLSRLIYCIICLVCVNVIYAQQSPLNILVLDNEDLKPLEFVSLYCNGSGAVTNSSGFATLNLDKGANVIRFSLVGYETANFPLNIDTVPGGMLTFKLAQITNLLNEVSVVSGRYERKLISEVASVEIIKPDLLRSNNLSTLEDLLDRVPGIQMIDGHVNIRGGAGFAYGAGSRVLLTVNDVPAMQPDAGFPNWRDIPVENMAQVEVLKGAGSVLYGSTAMNGVINFRTAWAGEKPETKISTQFTGFLTPKDESKKWWSSLPYESNTSIVHSQKFKKWDGVFGGNYFHSDSYNQGNYDHQGRLFANVKFNINPRWIVNINTLINKGESDAFVYWKNGNSGAYRGDSTSYSPSKKLRFFIDPVITYLGGNSTEHKLIGRYFSINNEVSNNQSQKAQMKYAEYRFRKSFRRVGLELTTGLVYTGTNMEAKLYGDTTYSSTNLAAYISMDKTFFKKLTISTGARYEYNELKSPEVVEDIIIPGGKTSESKPVFKFGGNFLITPFSSIRASWGQGYRYPTVAEKFISTTAGAIRVSPNPDLKSETGYTAEIGFKQGLKISNWKGFLDVAFFRSEYDNMMEFVLQNFSKGFQSFNIGNTRIQGYEVSLQGAGKIGEVTVRTMAGYTYLDPTYRNFDDIDTLKSTVNFNILKYRMKHSVRGDIGLIFKGFEIGAYYQYNSKMVAVDKIFNIFIPGVKEYRDNHDFGSNVIGFRFIAPLIRDKLNLGLNINNVFNTEYSIRPGLLEAPRNFSCRLDWKF